MKYIKRKAIQLRSWVSGSIRGDDGKISSVKTFYFFSGWFGAMPFAAFLLQALVWILKSLNFVLPYGIRFIEGLISALSYSLNKKEFFYAI
ncbi:hypothetical protein [Psychrobacillus sp. OK032]|uniref:hypothetical protein n=1 Tax=Psychrobacillus sp. OK032 TaxID=1884358 RepID=UPI0008D27983|nr:hypothetical protein [Psychrobacillus sp. OK032]SES17709.1 hypothetical protein SAMN05518872_105116 [Psychrobacillus sp. OK032]